MISNATLVLVLVLALQGPCDPLYVCIFNKKHKTKEKSEKRTKTK